MANLATYFSKHLCDWSLGNIYRALEPDSRGATLDTKPKHYDSAPVA